MLQWMGGSRRKLKATKKSLKARQHQFFEQRRQEAKERTLCQKSATTALETDQEKRSLDILGLENLSALPCVDESQAVAGDKVEVCGPPGSSHTTDERKAHLTQTKAFPANGSAKIQSDNPKPESAIQVSNNNKPDVVSSKNVSAAGVQRTPETSRSTAYVDHDHVLRASGLQPDFKVLDIIKDRKGEVSTQRSASEMYAAFTLEGIGRAGLHTPENITKRETPLSLRSNKRAEPHFASNISYSTTIRSRLPLWDSTSSSFAENANEHKICRSKERRIPVGIQKEPEPYLLSNRSPTSEDESMSSLLGCIGGENSSLILNPAFDTDRNPWNFPEFGSFTDVRCPERKEKTPPITEWSFPESSLLSLNEQAFHYTPTNLWSSPVICPTGWKEVCGDLVPDFEHEDIQLDGIVTNNTSHPYRTPKNIYSLQGGDEEESYLLSPASTVQILNLEESRDSTSSDRADFDKINYEMEDILGEWSSKLDLQGLCDIRNLDDCIQKTATISQNETHLHPISHSQFDDMDIKYKGISSEASSTIATEEMSLSNSEQDLKLLSIEEERSHEDLDSLEEAFCVIEDLSTKKRKSVEAFSRASRDSLPSTSGVGSIQIPFSPTSHPLHLPDEYVKTHSVPDSNHSPTRCRSVSFDLPVTDDYPGLHARSGDYTFSMQEYGEGDHEEETTIESAGTIPSEYKRNSQSLINEQKSDFSMFFQDLGESGLPTAETLIVYFPSVKDGREKESSRIFETVGAKDVAAGTDLRFEVADNMNHSLSPLREKEISHSFECAVNTQGSPLTRSCTGESIHDLDDIDLENSPGDPAETTMRLYNDDAGQSSIQTDNLFDMHYTKIENDDEKFLMNDFLTDKVEIDVLTEELHEIELKLLNSTTVALVVDVVCDHQIFKPLHQQQPIEGESWSEEVDVSERTPDSTKVPDENLHLDDLVADKIDVLTEKLHDFELELLKATSSALKMNTAYDYQELSLLKQHHQGESEKKSELSLPASKSNFVFCDKTMNDEVQHHLDQISNQLHFSKLNGLHDRLEEDFSLRLDRSNEQSYKGSIERRQKVPNGTQKRERENDPETKTISNTKLNECAFHLKHQDEFQESNIGRDKKRSRSDHHLEGGYNQASSANNQHNDSTQMTDKMESHCYIKDEGCEVGRRISDRQQEMNLKSSTSEKLEEERQSFHCSERSNHQAVSSKSSHGNKGHSKVNVGQQQESYGSNIEKGTEESSKTSSNLKKGENSADISSGRMKSDSSKKDDGYEENRSRNYHHYREEKQKSSSSIKLKEDRQAITPRETQHCQATSLTSSNKCSENKTSCLQQQQELRLSRGKKRIVIVSQLQPANDSNSEGSYDGKTKTQHHNLEEHEESSSIHRHKVELQISTQDNEKGYRTGPSHGISVNKDGNERGSRNQQQRSQGSNAAERREGNNGGYDSHGKSVPRRTPTNDVQVGESEEGAQREKGHDRDLHANHEEEKGASCSCRCRQISSSKKEVTNDEISERLNLHHQVTSLRHSLSDKDRQLAISAEHLVKHNKDLDSTSTEQSRQCSGHTNQGGRLSLKRLNADGPHHPQDEQFLSYRRSNPSVHLHLNSDQGLVEGGEDKTSKPVVDVKEFVDRSSQTSRMRTHTRTSNFGFILSPKQPVQSSKSIPGDTSVKEVHGSQSDSETRDLAQHTSATRTADKSRSPPLPIHSLSHDRHTPQAMQGSQKAEDLEVRLNRGDTGGTYDTEALKLSQTQQIGGPTILATGGGQRVQGAGTQYVTMLESFVMQLKFENKILQDTLVKQAKNHENQDGQRNL